ncbi:MAG TPA: hypothetical protein VFV61_09440 [Pyrinomonadaceae bacterium]|nr:hypothetical protein [Pyrinomonadaceae bacterium]
MSGKEEIKQPLRLNVKLAPRVKPGNFKKVLSGTTGLRSVIQTFPDERDEELSHLFIVEVEPDRATQALKELKDNPAVEYVERTAKRKLIR